MKKATKIWLIIAALLVVAGLALFTAAMSAYRWNFTRLSTVTYETNTYEISEIFTNISIDTDTADIIFLPSPDGKCRVECCEEEKAKHSVTVQEGTLTIQLMDERTVEDYIPYIGINIGSPKITVYLPEGQYASLSVRGSTGDIDVPEAMQFGDVDISFSTGDVSFSASAAASVKIKTGTGSIRMEHTSTGTLDLSVSTGHIAVSDVACEGNVQVSVSTGKVNFTNLRCQNLLSQGNTGDILLENVIAADSFSIERTTGDVTLVRCDASEIFIKTTTGDVHGSLLSEKIFIAQTDTGDVTVPRISSGGMCQIDTTTGDIHITLVS